MLCCSLTHSHYSPRDLGNPVIQIPTANLCRLKNIFREDFLEFIPPLGWSGIIFGVEFKNYLYNDTSFIIYAGFSALVRNFLSKIQYITETVQSFSDVVVIKHKSHLLDQICDSADSDFK